MEARRKTVTTSCISSPTARHPDKRHVLIKKCVPRLLQTLVFIPRRMHTLYAEITLTFRGIAAWTCVKHNVSFVWSRNGRRCVCT